MAYIPRLNGDSTYRNPYYTTKNPFYNAGYPMPNCTAYAWGRFWENADVNGDFSNRPLLSTGNADSWFNHSDPYARGTTPAEMLETAEKKIYALRKGERNDSLEHIGMTLHKVFDRLTELSQSDSAIPGLSTGLHDLDRKINGLNKSDLFLIAARPAMGKSAFALNIGLNVAKKYVMSYTGLDSEGMDAHEDLVIVIYVLCQNMYDDRTYYVDKGNINNVVESILNLHCTNFMPQLNDGE